VISERLNVDLSQIMAQLDQLKSSQREVDSRTAAVQRRVSETNTSVKSLERVTDQLFSKIKAQAKSLTKGGISQGLSSALDSMDLGDDPFTNWVKNITSSSLAGLSFGGLSGGLLAGTTSMLAGIKPMISEQERRLAALEREQKDLIRKFDEENERLRFDFMERMQDLKASIALDRVALEEKYEEVAYQTSQYVGE
jgi:chromosome segregation ATPase